MPTRISVPLTATQNQWPLSTLSRAAAVSILNAGMMQYVNDGSSARTYNMK